MIEIHLYGNLRNYAGAAQPRQDTVIWLEPDPGATIASMLADAGIPIGEVNHMFVNAKLLASRNSMASYYGYRQTGPDLTNWNLDVEVGDGDRIGLFGSDMAILGM